MDAPEPVKRSTMDRIWPFLSLIPLGAGAWAPIYAGYRARRPAWVLAGVACTVTVLIGLMIPSAKDGDNSFAGGFIIIGWIAAMAFSFALRGAFDRRMGSPWRVALEEGRDRLEQREAALQLAASNPALAAEVGIGRPDRTDGIGAGLVDVNNASASALGSLPRVDDEVATRIVELRTELDGFASVEDLGAALDLGGSDVEALRGLVVFLPRRR